MAWNLNEYEDVASLNRWFQDNFPTGRIVLSFVHEDWENQEVVMECALFRDANDLEPAVVNVARGKATDYPKNMQRWYLEDTATSAIGRAILLIKGANKTATQDSMRYVTGDQGHKVEHPNKPTGWDVPQDAKPIENEPQTVVWDEEESTAFQSTGDFIGDLQRQLGATVEGFKCAHGDMLKKEGTSKAGKPYFGYVCGAKSKADQCEAKWAKIVGGKWVFEGKAAD